MQGRVCAPGGKDVRFGSCLMRGAASRGGEGERWRVGHLAVRVDRPPFPQLLIQGGGVGRLSHTSRLCHH